MSVNLKVDPRTARRFTDYGLPSAVLSKLSSQFSSPLSIQSRMLALNASGVSVYARSTPNSGKTTAAILGLLSTPRQPAPLITNLVLVPFPALADQYREQMVRFGGKPEHCQVLYRTGSVDEDEQQHKDLMAKKKVGVLTSLISTPQRLLDYISTDPSLLALRSLRQIVIDELDVFGSVTPLETLLEYILRQPESDPILSFIMTHNSRKEFLKLPQLLQGLRRPLYEASTPDPEWTGKIIEHDDANIHDIPACLKQVTSVWTGPGLVIPPPSTSASQLQARLATKLEGAVVVQPGEVAGLHINDLENIYILGAEEHAREDIERLKWMLQGKERNLHLINE